MTESQSERSGPGLVQRLRSFFVQRKDDAELGDWFKQFARDMAKMREELIGSLEKFSREFNEENAAVKADFRSRVSERVEHFKKEVDAELQKRRIALEEDFADFSKRMNEAWKDAEARFLSHMHEEQSRAKDAFLTETEQERSRVEAELSELQRQRAARLEEEADKFLKKLIDRQNDGYRAMEAREEGLQNSFTQALESTSENLQKRFGSEVEPRLKVTEERVKERLAQIEKKINADVEACVSSITRELRTRKFR